VLDPEVTLCADLGGGRPALVLRGVSEVAKLARAPQGAELHRVLVNGEPGAIVTIAGRPFSLLAFTVATDRIVAIGGITDGERVARLAASLASRRPVRTARRSRY
jgi:RNA polymerase sigma-70 factor (ECF subfamily)